MPMNQIMVFTIDRNIWMILGMKSPTFVIELLIGHKESVHGRSAFLSSKKDSAFENDLFFSLHQRGVILHT